MPTCATSLFFCVEALLGRPLLRRATTPWGAEASRGVGVSVLLSSICADVLDKDLLRVFLTGALVASASDAARAPVGWRAAAESFASLPGPGGVFAGTHLTTQSFRHRVPLSHAAASGDAFTAATSSASAPSRMPCDFAANGGWAGELLAAAAVVFFKREAAGAAEVAFKVPLGFPGVLLAANWGGGTKRAQISR